MLEYLPFRYVHESSSMNWVCRCPELGTRSTQQLHGKEEKKGVKQAVTFISYMYSKSALGVLSSLVFSNVLIHTLILATFPAVWLVSPMPANTLAQGNPFLSGTFLNRRHNRDVWYGYCAVPHQYLWKITHVCVGKQSQPLVQLLRLTAKHTMYLKGCMEHRTGPNPCFSCRIQTFVRLCIIFIRVLFVCADDGDDPPVRAIVK